MDIEREEESSRIRRARERSFLLSGRENNSMNRVEYVGKCEKPSSSSSSAPFPNEYLMPIAPWPLFLYRGTGKLFDPSIVSRPRKRERERERGRERRTELELRSNGGKRREGRNLEITRPNDKKTVEEGKKTRFVPPWKAEGVKEGGGVKIRALRERLIKGCKLTRGNDAGA